MASDKPVEKNIYRPAPPQLVQVKSITDISPSIRSITFTGERLGDYPTQCEGGHIKIFLAPDLKSEPALPILSEQGAAGQKISHAPLCVHIPFEQSAQRLKK